MYIVTYNYFVYVIYTVNIIAYVFRSAELFRHFLGCKVNRFDLCTDSNLGNLKENLINLNPIFFLSISRIYIECFISALFTQLLLNGEFGLCKHFCPKVFVLITSTQAYFQLSEICFASFVTSMKNSNLF